MDNNFEQQLAAYKEAQAKYEAKLNELKTQLAVKEAEMNQLSSQLKEFFGTDNIEGCEKQLADQLAEIEEAKNKLKEL